MTFLTKTESRYQIVALKFAESVDSIKEKTKTEDGFIVYLTSDGNITTEPGDKTTTANLILFPEKRLRMRGNIGNRMDANYQKLYKALLQSGIIDKTWTLSGSITDTNDTKDFDFLADPKNTITHNPQGNFVLYHGTSSLDWEKIKRKGLLPLFHGGNDNAGYESRFKAEHNKKVLYLASTLDGARGYAGTRCSSLERDADKAKTLVGMKGHGWPVGIRNNDKVEELYPVVLEVTVPDLSLLVADDDHVNQLARDIAREIWAKKPEEERIKIATELFNDPKRDPSVVCMLWRESPAGFAEIMKSVPTKVYTEWFESIKNQNQVGYRGVIMPKFLKLVWKEYKS